MKQKQGLNARLPVTAGVDTERFRQFQKTVFGSKDNHDPLSLTTQIFGRNLKSIRSAAIIVILANAFWLIMDIVKDGEMNLSSGPALAAIIVQILFSCYILALPVLSRDKSEKMVEYSFLAYYICLIVGVTILGVTKNMQMLEAGTNHKLAGLPLSTCYLFILVLAPLPSKRDSIILGCVFLVMFLVPAFMPGRELYSLPQQGILRVCMVAAYWYIRDVNIALADSMQRLSVLSFTDSLTNALNRRALDTYWNSICEEKAAAHVGVLIFDIDDFKKYNDCYSHARGNDVLRDVCTITINALKGDASFLFRYGGEEFVVLLLDYTDEEILRCGQRINRAISEARIARDDHSGFDRITVTVGCAREEVSEPHCKDYIIHADEQLYIGKNQGKNCVVMNGTLYR